MKKFCMIVVSLLAAASYVLPFTVTKAGTDPVNPSVLPVATQTYHIRITAYASVPDQTDDTPFITADGSYVHDGIIAANFLPFGTKVKIPSLYGDKIFTVNDRMAARFKKSVDIWMPTVAKAIHFGMQYTDIVVVKPTVKNAVAIAGK